MDFEWMIPGIFEDIAEGNYINVCCVGGDKVLEQLKADIAVGLEITATEIDIYQEDWGWGMEFLKNGVTYSLAVNNQEFSENGKTLFGACSLATRKIKGRFLDKTIDAPDELNNFSKIILQAAKKNGFENN